MDETYHYKLCENLTCIPSAQAFKMDVINLKGLLAEEKNKNAALSGLLAEEKKKNAALSKTIAESDELQKKISVTEEQKKSEGQKTNEHKEEVVKLKEEIAQIKRKAADQAGEEVKRAKLEVRAEHLENELARASNETSELRKQLKNTGEEASRSIQMILGELECARAKMHEIAGAAN